MRVLAAILFFYQQLVLVYFAALNLLYAFFGYLGLRSVVVYSRELPQVALKDLLEREFYKPVTILVPAFNEEAGIVPSVRSLLSLHYPEFEVIVSNDGSTDRTLARMTEAFALVEVPQIYRRVLETLPVHRVLRSLRHPNLTVIDKERGGRSDALNAAVNLARYPLVCEVDADSLLDAEARLAFGSDWSVAPLDPLSGVYAAVTRRTIDGKRPGGWVPEEKISLGEALRAYTAGNAYGVFAESKWGTLAPKYYADAVVLDRDLFRTPPESLDQVRVRYTIVAGRVVFRRP